MIQALKGIRVIAVEHAVAAPLCSRHLSEMGAEVIKIERPGSGDFARNYDSYVLGESSHFSWLNRGKKSVVLDLKTEVGKAHLKALLESADVLVCNLAPGDFERILSDAELDAMPKLIRCHISGYGTEGPYAERKAYDLLVQGEAGVIASTGTEEQKARPGISVGDLAGGTYALAAINAALVERARTGRGQRIDIALFDTLVEWMSPLLLIQKYAGAAPPPAGRGHASITPYGPYLAGDGKEIQIAVQNDHQWIKLCREVIDRPDLADNPAYATNSGRFADRERVEREVSLGFANFDGQTLLERLEAADLPYGIMRDVPEVVSHPQLAARGRWVSARNQANQDFEALLPPFVSNRDSLGVRKVPTLGEHTGEILEPNTEDQPISSERAKV
jgi:crotonobetainyl-CoA:carnitine CoA-transferase CaiB-like acyl-CoA transferase